MGAITVRLYAYVDDIASRREQYYLPMSLAGCAALRCLRHGLNRAQDKTSVAPKIGNGV